MVGLGVREGSSHVGRCLAAPSVAPWVSCQDVQRGQVLTVVPGVPGRLVFIPFGPWGHPLRGARSSRRDRAVGQDGGGSLRWQGGGETLWGGGRAWWGDGGALWGDRGALQGDVEAPWGDGGAPVGQWRGPMGQRRGFLG